MVSKSKPKDKVEAKDTPGPGSYKLRSFVELENKPQVVFGSAPRFPKPRSSASQAPPEEQNNFSNENKLALNRYFDRIGKEGPF